MPIGVICNVLAVTMVLVWFTSAAWTAWIAPLL